MKLALFDLDHTLIPFDSGMAWTRFLVRAGALTAHAEERYLQFCHQYVAGTLDIHAMHRASMAPLAAFGRDQLLDWQHAFGLEMAEQLPHAMRELVGAHQDSGDLCRRDGHVTLGGRALCAGLRRTASAGYRGGVRRWRAHGRDRRPAVLS